MKFVADWPQDRRRLVEVEKVGEMEVKQANGGKPEQLEQENAVLKAQLEESERTLRQLTDEARGLRIALTHHEGRINALLNSYSWRITAPLRLPIPILRRLMSNTKTGRFMIHGLLRAFSLLAQVRRSEIRALLSRDRRSKTPDLAMSEQADAISYRPLISILMPTYNIGKHFLSLAIDSVIHQGYPEWELCICDDGSTNQETLEALRQCVQKDPRIRIQFHSSNQGISAATNTALQMALGEYVAMLDHDDELLPGALYEVVRLLNDHPDADVVYTDQDYIEVDGTVAQHFHKPDWSPELFRGVMYVGHLLVVRRALANLVGGFDSRFDNVQDFEFMLRLSERTTRIYHVPKILYHWRKVPGSVAFRGDEKSNIEELQAEAVSEHLKRCSVPATAFPHPNFAHRAFLQPHPRSAWPRVSIIMVAEKVDPALEHGVKSVFATCAGRDVEVILVHRKEIGEELKNRFGDHPIGLVGVDDPRRFTWAQANNLGVTHASGEYLVFMNGGLEVVTRDWVELMLFHLELRNVGCVGPLLLGPDDRVQHAGFVLGLDGTVGSIMRGYPSHSDGYAGSLSCTREVTGVSGDCLMVSRRLFEELSGFQEYFVQSYPAADLALRLFNRGKRNLFTPRIVFRYLKDVFPHNHEDALDRALFVDRWNDLIKRGDPYYNPNFSLDRYDYSVG
jgi:GT2 family glycosyltransferase